MRARSVLMVTPADFHADPETARDNAFQHENDSRPVQEIRDAALREFNEVAAGLRNRGVEVAVFDGKPELPGSTFANNWFSTHADGTLVLYPMSTLGRRLERRPDIVRWLEARYPQVVDLTQNEDRGEYLEGTGSLVLDDRNRLAFAGRSIRTSPRLVENWCADFEYEPVIFDTIGPRGLPVYHTNVLLSLGTGYAVACTECISNPLPVLSALLSTDREVIEITTSQMAAFCGNVLELRDDEPVLLMSGTAHQAFTSTQLKTLESYASLLVADVPTIERYGGGSVRCMVGELSGSQQGARI